MNARSIWRNLSVAAVCSLLIAACGGATTQAPAKEPVKEAPAATAKEITIRWRTRPSDAAEQKVYDELNKLANDKLNGQGIKVMYDPGVNQGYFEKIKTEMAAGNPRISSGSAASKWPTSPPPAC